MSIICFCGALFFLLLRKPRNREYLTYAPDHDELQELSSNEKTKETEGREIKSNPKQDIIDTVKLLISKRMV
jgi:hypothetical protein